MREGVTDVIFDASFQSLRRVAAGAKLLPSPLVATIARKSFGPLLCARAAGAVDPATAIEVAKRLPSGFLADVTIQLDPRRVAAIISRVPEDLVVPVAAELGRREEHVTMGRFLAYVPDESVVAAMAALTDEALLRTAFVLEHKDRLDHALGLLPPERLPGIIASASSLGLWPEALDLLEHLSDVRRGPVADQDAEVIEGLVATVSGAGIWENLLPLGAGDERGPLPAAGGTPRLPPGAGAARDPGRGGRQWVVGRPGATAPGASGPGLRPGPTTRGRGRTWCRAGRSPSRALRTPDATPRRSATDETVGRCSLPPGLTLTWRQLP